MLEALGAASKITSGKPSIKPFVRGPRKITPLSHTARVVLPAGHESRIYFAEPTHALLSDADLACRIDRLADQELHLGHHAAAERL